VIVLALLGFVLTQPEHKGARRWIDIGPLQVQPSEIAKMVALLATAVFLDKRGWKVGLFWKGALPTAAIFGLMTILILKEPDFGSTVIVGAMGVTLMWIAGVKFWHIIYLSAAGLVLVGVSLVHNENRMRRLIPMLPESIGSKLNAMLNLPFDATSAAKVKTALYQKEQSIIAIQRGGITGVGFNQSQQKYKYLPERHTDFIFAVFSEEFGLIGFGILMSIYLYIITRCLYISLRADNTFSRLLWGAISLTFFFYIFVNIGMVSGILPVVGVPLPLISYGGTSMVTLSAGFGIIMAIHTHKERKSYPDL
jgi:rod shape determining protein RodA